MTRVHVAFRYNLFLLVKNADKSNYLLCFQLDITASCRLKMFKKRKRRKRIVWVKDWLLQRGSKGAFNQIFEELRLGDPASFQNYVRMNAKTFEVSAQFRNNLFSQYFSAPPSRFFR